MSYIDKIKDKFNLVITYLDQFDYVKTEDEIVKATGLIKEIVQFILEELRIDGKAFVCGTWYWRLKKKK